jgi:hypothetical protein
LSAQVAPDKHLPLLHRAPLLQSASVAQLVLHWPALMSHEKAPQSIGIAVGQCPFPSQVAAAVTWLPLQLAARQDVADPTNPSQLVAVMPSHSADEHGSEALPPEHAARAPCGAPTTGVHVPSVPFASHAAHWPVQALLQQTPSAQIAEVHSFPALHEAPFAPFFTHVEALQYASFVHSASVAHAEGQDPAAHAKSPQETPLGFESQRPTPLQMRPFAELLVASQVLVPHETPAA